VFFTSTRFWLHPITLSAIIGVAILFVALGGNLELLWIPGAAALGAAIGSDWSRASGSDVCVCGLPEAESTPTRVERTELSPTVVRRPTRHGRARDPEPVLEGVAAQGGRAAPMPRARERSADDRRRRP
jgi:hypothetical protein